MSDNFGPWRTPRSIEIFCEFNYQSLRFNGAWGSKKCTLKEEMQELLRAAGFASFKRKTKRNSWRMYFIVTALRE